MLAFTQAVRDMLQVLSKSANSAPNPAPNNVIATRSHYKTLIKSEAVASSSKVSNSRISKILASKPAVKLDRTIVQAQSVATLARSADKSVKVLSHDTLIAAHREVTKAPNISTKTNLSSSEISGNTKVAKRLDNAPKIKSGNIVVPPEAVSKTIGKTTVLANNNMPINVLPRKEIGSVSRRLTKGSSVIAEKGKTDKEATAESRKFNLQAKFNSEVVQASKQFVSLENGVGWGLLKPDSNKPAVTAYLNTVAPKIDFIKEAQEQHNNREEVQIGNGLIQAAKCDCDQFNDKELVNQFNKQNIRVSVDSENNCLCLERGNIIFSPKHRIIVKLPEGIVQIAGGAIVLVMKQSNFLALYDLHQGKVAAVQLVVGKKSIELYPGLLVALPKQSIDNFDALNLTALNDIAYRNARHLEMGNQINGFLAEFSIPSIITKTIPLREMLKSSDSREHSKMDKMLNDSIALMEAASYGGPYHSSAQ